MIFWFRKKIALPKPGSNKHFGRASYYLFIPPCSCTVSNTNRQLGFSLAWTDDTTSPRPGSSPLAPCLFLEMDVQDFTDHFCVMSRPAAWDHQAWWGLHHHKCLFESLLKTHFYCFVLLLILLFNLTNLFMYLLVLNSCIVLFIVLFYQGLTFVCHCGAFCCFIAFKAPFKGSI